LVSLGSDLRRRWQVRAVAVTLGQRGALLLVEGRAPLIIRPPYVADGDPCGAGDQLAVAATSALRDGMSPEDAIHAGVTAASDYVARGGASGVWGTGEPVAGAAGPGGTAGPAASTFDARVGLAAAGRVVAAVRASGGTVVATCGCFDLLHVGHISTLETTRSLGDCLIVFVNSDASVRKLKAENRPVVTQAERAQTVATLPAVDAVVVFDDETPDELLGDWCTFG